ncbi:MAG: GNAT family N-acetyltransferase [Candidatus Neomarinimicrobiota bacterium]
MVYNITFEAVSYSNRNHQRILKSCFEKWFSDPKDLHLTAPSLKYPFNFKTWVKASYSSHLTQSYVLKLDNWIVGYMSLQLQPKNDFLHLFHVFVDKDYRKKGLGKLIINKAINVAKELSIPILTLYVNTENSAAINLYKQAGFNALGHPHNHGMKMVKYINQSD